MGSFYRILGAKVPAWALSVGTISAAVGAGVYSSSGKKDAPTEASAVPAAGKANGGDEIDVEKVLNDFLKDNEDKKAA